MQSFLSTFFLTSITLAASVPATIPCNRIPLYRIRSKKPVNAYFFGSEGFEKEPIKVIDYIETTNKDERKSEYDLDRQIATICSNPATGTVPLYNVEYPVYGFGVLHSSSTSEYLSEQDSAKIIGYVYTAKQGEASLKIYKKRKDHKVNGEIKLISFLATENEDEAKDQGYTVNQVLFYSAP